jgi:hypothetical protein
MGLAEKVVARYKRAGGSSFEEYVQNPDVKAAWRQAIDDAIHEHGHGSYSGTIKEKNEYEIRRRDPMTKEEAYEFMSKDMENNDKWGPAFAIPIGESSQSGEKKFKLKVPLSSRYGTPTNPPVGTHDAIVKALKEKGVLPAGSTTNIKIEKITLVKEGKLPELKIEKGGPEGFRVRGGNATFYGDRSPIFASRADAVKAIKESLLREHPQPGQKFVVERFKTTDQFTVGDITKSMHLYEVEGTATGQKSTGKIIGWYFYGIASS